MFREAKNESHHAMLEDSRFSLQLLALSGFILVVQAIRAAVTE